MKITDKTKELIKYLANNDLYRAKRCAAIILEDDKTKTNAEFVEKYKKIYSETMDIPTSLKKSLNTEILEDTFIEDRYILSEREETVFKQISRINKVGNELIKLNIPYLNSTLLHGASGTGKTLFSKYVAYKLGLPFYYINFSSVIDSLLGKTSSNISEIFQFARWQPCVLMLDEIDCIAIDRTTSKEHGASEEMARITITLMQELDRLSNNVVLIAATNRLDRIDKALYRRFSIIHEVKLFSESEKEKLAKTFLNNVNFEVGEFELKQLIANTSGQSELINELIKLIAVKIENRFKEEENK